MNCFILIGDYKKVLGCFHTEKAVNHELEQINKIKDIWLSADKFAKSCANILKQEYIVKMTPPKIPLSNKDYYCDINERNVLNGRSDKINDYSSKYNLPKYIKYTPMPEVENSERILRQAERIYYEEYEERFNKKFIIPDELIIAFHKYGVQKSGAIVEKHKFVSNFS